jgi:hypothetical protein
MWKQWEHAVAAEKLTKKTCCGRDIRRRKRTAARRRRETDKVVCLFFILYAISCFSMWTQFRTKRSKNGLTNRHSLYARGQTKDTEFLMDSVHCVRAITDRNPKLSGPARAVFFLLLRCWTHGPRWDSCPTAIRAFFFDLISDRSWTKELAQKFFPSDGS